MSRRNRDHLKLNNKDDFNDNNEQSMQYNNDPYTNNNDINTNEINTNDDINNNYDGNINEIHNRNDKRISKKLLEKRKQLHLQREANEKEYQRMMSIRPHGGNGVVGGTPINEKLTYVPHEIDILKTMQDLDIDYIDAKQFLITEKEIYCKENNITIEKDQLRRARVNKLMSKQREKDVKKELYEKELKRKENEKINQYKEKCRQKGLLLLEKNKEIDRKNQRIVELGREHRVITRINQFDHNDQNNNNNSSSSSRISDTTNNGKLNSSTEKEMINTPKYQLRMNLPSSSSSSLLLRREVDEDKHNKKYINKVVDVDNTVVDGDDDDDYNYEYDVDGDNYDVFKDVDDDDDTDDEVDNNNNNNNNLNNNNNNNNNNNIANDINSSPVQLASSQSISTYLHSHEWKQLLLLSNEDRDIILHTMMEKMTNVEMFQQEIPSLMTVIQEVQNNHLYKESTNGQEIKSIEGKKTLEGLKGPDDKKGQIDLLKNDVSFTSSTTETLDNTNSKPLSIDKLRQYRLKHYHYT